MAGYIGTAAVPQATQKRQAFTATAGQTSFATSGYSVGFVDVYMNGVKLAAADYTATNGSDVVLATAALVNDIIEIVAFTSFVADGSLPATGGTITGNLNVAGTVSSTGKVALPATLGTANQVLTVNSGATAAAWANPSSSFASLSDTTVSSSNPTISSNPASGVGHVWVNTTTGFVYVLRNATAGANIWTNVGRGTTDVETLTIVTATGGTVTTDGDFKVHTFTSSGTFVVTNTTGTLEPITYLMVGGGGSGGAKSTTDMIQGGGGGAGGLLTGTQTLALNTSYSVTIGAGAAYVTSTSNPANGGNTTFSSFTALGGGRGGSGLASQPNAGMQAVDGGSGGGKGIWGEGLGTGNALAVGRIGIGTSGQGNNGGNSDGTGRTGSNRVPVAAGGGGGAGGVGQNPANTSTGGVGGVGVQSSISGTATYYGGGGGGGGSTTSGAGGQGGASINAAGSANTGAGGGGARQTVAGSANRIDGYSGGSGIVIIRYKFQ